MVIETAAASPLTCPNSLCFLLSPHLVALIGVCVCVSDEADLSWRCLKLFLAVKIMFCPLSQNKICNTVHYFVKGIQITIGERRGGRGYGWHLLTPLDWCRHIISPLIFQSCSALVMEGSQFF